MEQHIKDLFYKYLSGKADEQDLIALYEYFDMEPNERQLIELINEHLRAEDLDASEKEMIIADKLAGNAWAGIKGKLEPELKPKIKRISLKRISAVAALLLITGVFSYIFFTHYYKQTNEKQLIIADVAPGTNKATLVLSDGKQYELSDNANGITSSDKGIGYADGEMITNTSLITQATIKVPNGGQYKISLPDGTKVMLNSGTELSYPTRFTGNERLVNITGEAYFEVSHDASKPFKVRSDKQTITVLGTHFNIKAYKGEVSETTLLEGKVSIASVNNPSVHTILNPGLQASFNGNQFNTIKVSAEEYTAWTRDLFIFNNLTLQQLCAQLERWYDVQIILPPNIAEQRYLMEIPRDKKLSETLTSISELIGLNYKIEGRRVTVTLR